MIALIILIGLICFIAGYLSGGVFAHRCFNKEIMRGHIQDIEGNIYTLDNIKIKDKK